MKKDELVTIYDRLKTLKHSSSNTCEFAEHVIAIFFAVLESDISADAHHLNILYKKNQDIEY
jgi:hypothetical protein